MASKIKRASTALRKAADMLAEEGAWVKGTMKSEKSVDTPMCGSWGHCAAGVLAEVTGDLHRVGSYSWDNNAPRFDVVRSDNRSPLFQDASSFLSRYGIGAKRLLEAEGGPSAWFSLEGAAAAVIEDPISAIIEFNDSSDMTRKKVINAFLRAANAAQKAEQRERQAASRAARKASV